jgi:hypothetical protein
LRGQLAERDLGALRGAVAVRVADQGDRRVVRVPDDGHDRRGDVVVDGADRRGHEGVHQLALALLELADDEYPHRGIGQPLLGSPQPGRQIRSLVSRRGLGRDLDELDRLGHRHVVPLLATARRAGFTAEGPVASPPLLGWATGPGSGSA